MPNTAVLAVSAIVIAIFIGITLGIISALFKDRWLDKIIQIFSTLGMSVPSFFSAILFAWVFGFVVIAFSAASCCSKGLHAETFAVAH